MTAEIELSIHALHAAALPSYTLRGVGLSRNGKQLAFDAVNTEGFQLHVIQLGPRGELSAPRLIFKSEKEAWGALLSSVGDLAAMMSTASRSA